MDTQRSEYGGTQTDSDSPTPISNPFAITIPTTGTVVDMIHSSNTPPGTLVVDDFSNDTNTLQIGPSVWRLLEGIKALDTVGYTSANGEPYFFEEAAPQFGGPTDHTDQATFSSILPALPQASDGMAIEAEVDDDSLRMFESYFPAPESPYTSAQYPSGTPHTSHDLLLPELDLIHIPQVDLDMDTIIGTTHLSGRHHVPALRMQAAISPSSSGTTLRLMQSKSRNIGVANQFAVVVWLEADIFAARTRRREHERKVHHRGVYRRRG